MALRLASKLLVVGDSISYGEHLLDRRGQAWPYLLGRETGHEAVNLSVCGDTTRKALERAQLWQPACKGAVVFVQFGLNDANRWESDGGIIPRVSLPAFRENLREIGARALQHGALRVIFCGLTQHARPVPTLAECRRYDTNVAVASMDFGGLFVDVAKLGLLPTIDGMHLDPVGHARYAEAARRVLERCLWLEVGE